MKPRSLVGPRCGAAENRRADAGHRVPTFPIKRVAALTCLLIVAAASASHAQTSAVVSSEFIYEHAPYPQCHASTIAEVAPGRLVAAWFGGTRERAPDVGIWIARHEEGRWFDPVEVANGIQPDGTRQPTWNPVLFQPPKGPLVLFYKVGPTPREWWGMMMTSSDGGKTWSKPRRLPNGILGPIKNKPVLLPDGAWLCPSSTESTNAGCRVHLELTRDAGDTWKVAGPVEKGQPPLDALQPSVLFHRDGRLQALCRTRNGVIASTGSNDGGKTWSPVVSTGLPNPNSGIDAVTLADGRQLLVYNHSAPPPERPAKGVRYPLDVALSSNGVDWRHVLTLESEARDEGYAYPAVIQTSDGLVHITYTWDRKRIKHVVLDPRKLDTRLGASGQSADSGHAATDVRPNPNTTVCGLRCEFSTDPLGIDVAQPRLFWRMESRLRGQRQSAWRILVASSLDTLAQDRGDLWDSGRVASDQTTFVRYAGAPLASSQRVFWKVRAWDRDGRATPWSEPATWTMGLLAPGDWKGVWIAAPHATESLLLRRAFVVRPGLRRAVAHVCGLGQYELTFNGREASDDLLTPGWTDYDKTTLYDTYDVTSLLRDGTNAVGLVLGNGMYNVVRRNRFAKFTGSFGPLRAILHLRLEYRDGSTEFVGTDESWRYNPGPITYNSIYGGEDCDARLEPAGWSRPGFDDTAWGRAVAVLRVGDTLRGHGLGTDPVRAIESRQPVAVRNFSDGTVVYDLGQNASYMLRLRVRGPAGSTVRLTPAEIVNDEGRINRSTMGGTSRGSSWWEYTKATDGEETWFPRFYYVGCRYLEARGAPAVAGGELPRIASLEGVLVHSTAAPVGEFACSNELLNRIRGLVRWAQRSNLMSILTDCPHREKLGWLEQDHLNGPALRYEFDLARLFAKAVNDMAEAQTDDGLVPNIAPEYTKFKGAFRAATEWGSAFIIVPWQQYEFTGDLDLLRNHYDAMKRYFAWVERGATNDIVTAGLGDWYDLGPKKPGAAQLTPPPVTATAFYHQDAWILSQVAELLGRADEAREFAAKASRIRAGYNRHFFSRDKASYATGSQCANAVPLALGIVDPHNRDAVLVSLVRTVESDGYAVTAGDIGFRFLLRALTLGGHSDVIDRMINQNEKPGYGYQLKRGATSLTESWDANNSSSHNHLMLGQITEWFYRDLAGIDCDPAGAGFKKILINPHPVDDLQWVEAVYKSIHGPIAVRWERDGERFVLKATIPANTSATVFLPARDIGTLREGGGPVERSPGVTFLRHEGDRAVFQVESGSYVFESRW